MDKQIYDYQRSWIEIDLKAIRHNVNELLSLLEDKSQFMAVVKADAYGHGAVELAKMLNQMDITSFAVATLGEAIELRENGIVGNILILGYTEPTQAYLLKQYHLIQTVVDDSYGKVLNNQKIDVDVHIAVDSGMHRLGNSNISEIEKIYQLKYLHIKGIFSHLCVCDERRKESKEFTIQQMNQYFDILNKLTQEGYEIGKTHIQSSYGLINYPNVHCDLVRIGIAMYGVYSSVYDIAFSQIHLIPALSLKSKVILMRRLDENETVGYGRTYKADHDRIIAVVPIGYADGIPRSLSNKGKVIVNGQFVPIIGRICMDQLMIDITGKNIKVGDIVTIIGNDGNVSQGIETLANISNTISNELLSQIGKRLPRIYKGESYES